MARVNDRNKLPELSDLLDVLRAKGVLKYSGSVPGMGEGLIEVLMGPVLPTGPAKKEEADPLAFKRAHYMNLLGRSNIGDEELKLLPDGV